jgi:hypothetical protein
MTQAASTQVLAAFLLQSFLLGNALASALDNSDPPKS